MSQSSPNSTAQFLYGIFQDINIRSVAWPGALGRQYYRVARNCSKSLARLSSLAENDVDLLHLAAGWKRIRSLNCGKKAVIERENPLVAVIGDLSPRMLETLENLQSNGLNMLIIFADEECKYCSVGSQFAGKTGLNWPGPYAKFRGIHYPEPVICGNKDKLKGLIFDCLDRTGVSIIHVMGEAQFLRRGVSSQEEETTEKWLSSCQDPSMEDLSFSAVAVQRIAEDLKNIPEVVCLWARKEPPGALACLNNRLQRCSTKGLMLQAVGMAASGSHPLAAISAEDIPALLPDLLEIAPFPITFMVMNAGLSLDDEPVMPVPSQIHDLSLLRNIPGSAVAVPSNEEDARGMLKALLALPTPGFIRLTNSPAVGMPPEAHQRALPPGVGCRMRSGNHISFVCLGTPVYHAMLSAVALKSWGFEAGVYDMRYLEPLDIDLLYAAAQTGKVVTIEEHATVGGLGSLVLETISQAPPDKVPLGTNVKVIGINPNLESCCPEDHAISIDGILNQAKLLLAI